ncbi:MAG: translation initiation factor IF-3 C-terminal domain-containing protein, partial [Crenarchaeota archaeon]|nr:translation initiation factor IF-3 C-terminal domain-containing protein [Thermoproteota archaeon]
RKAREMLEDGHKVRFRLVFRGRQIVHPEIAKELMKKIAAELSDMAEVEQDIKGEGRIMTMVLRPLSKKK